MGFHFHSHRSIPILILSFPLPFPFPRYSHCHSHSHGNPMGHMRSQSFPFPCRSLNYTYTFLMIIWKVICKTALKFHRKLEIFLTFENLSFIGLCFSAYVILNNLTWSQKGLTMPNVRNLRVQTEEKFSKVGISNYLLTRTLSTPLQDTDRVKCCRHHH